MPIYEYHCGKCQRKTSVLVRNVSTFTGPVCSFCGSTELSRLVSSFAVLKGDDTLLDSFADDPSKLAGVDENDPRSVAKWMRKLSKEMGEEMDPEFDEMIEKMEAGEMPEEFAQDGAMGDSGLGSDDLDDM